MRFSSSTLASVVLLSAAASAQNHSSVLEKRDTAAQPQASTYSCEYTCPTWSYQDDISRVVLSPSYSSMYDTKTMLCGYGWQRTEDAGTCRYNTAGQSVYNKSDKTALSCPSTTSNGDCPSPVAFGDASTKLSYKESTSSTEYLCHYTIDKTYAAKCFYNKAKGGRKNNSETKSEEQCPLTAEQSCALRKRSQKRTETENEKKLRSRQWSYHKTRAMEAARKRR
ncbi:hypothetical protein [Phaffia rhodozyma]|uniref:Uncharacterized protein n=1 Tax=Phaffia rhodozyma TaxID=264483 RepID=A0A0F7SKR8_PHARH|nr:hypothetical protein [Phaffia rhodozyma]